MTIQNEVYREDYNGNDSTTSFPVSFYFFDDAHIQVTLVAGDNTETVQVLNTDYTVVGAGNPAGGSVEMVVPPATGERLVIVRDVPVTQLLDYVENDNFPAESHEGGLDKLTMIVQQQQEQLDRSVQASVGASVIITLPVPDAGKALQWNQAEDNLQNTQFNPDDAEAAANAAAASADKAEKWAEEDEDVEVEPGSYSAKHWATKAQIGGIPIFVNNPNGNPTIDDTPFDVTLVDVAWESIGPTGSGADNIWAAMDILPNGVNWIELRIVSTCSRTTLGNQQDALDVFARRTGSTQGVGEDNKILALSAISDDGGDSLAKNVTVAKVPVDGSKRFDLSRSDSFPTTFCSAVLVGYGFN